MRSEISKKYEYINELVTESQLQKKARQESVELGREKISLSPTEGSILKMLAFGLKAEKIVEIGTLTGLSALYLSETLSASAQVWTLEKDPEHSRRALKIFNASEKRESIHLIEGDARVTLQSIEAKGPFDLVFIDANKSGYGDYLVWAQKNVKSGGLIVADNVFLGGAVWGEPTAISFSKKQVSGMKEFNHSLMQSPAFVSCILPTDEGLLVACKK